MLKHTFSGCSCGASNLSLFLHLSIRVNLPVLPVACANAYTTSWKEKNTNKMSFRKTTITYLIWTWFPRQNWSKISISCVIETCVLNEHYFYIVIFRDSNQLQMYENIFIVFLSQPLENNFLICFYVWTLTSTTWRCAKVVS